MRAKLNIALAAAGGIYYYYSKNKEKDKESESATIPVPAETPDFFTKYDNRIVIDKNGYWMLVSSGKIYVPDGQASLDQYVAKNPGIAFENVNEDIWKYYAENFPEIFAGKF